MIRRVARLGPLSVWLWTGDCIGVQIAWRNDYVWLQLR